MSGAPPLPPHLLPLGGQPLDLGVVGNSTLAALVDRAGRINWLCWPRMDGDPVFCALLDGTDPAHGFLDVIPAGLRSGTQSYRRNTAILETVLEDSDGGRLRITDFAPWARRTDTPTPPPMLIRRLEPVAGRPLVTVRLCPRAGWGAETPERHLGGGTIRFTGTGQTLRLTTDAPVANIAEEAPFLLDRPLTLVLGPDEALTETPGALGERLLRETEDEWTHWARGLGIPFEWQDAVIRSAITLKLCAVEETGAVLAALTTSIPEAPGSSRNWDYRYCWPRDAAFTVGAMNALGTTHTMERFIHFISTVIRLAQDGPAGARLNPVYAIVPTRPLPECEAEHLAGFLGMGPVRVGNQAAEQDQHDPYGTVLLSAARMFLDRRLIRPADEGDFRLLEKLGEFAEANALRPDAGIWEFRGKPAVRTVSAALCWAGMVRLAAVAAHLGLEKETARWRTSAERLRETILDRFFSPDMNAFVESLGSEGTDASLLLLPRIGFIEATDPRFLGTLDLIGRRLLRDGFLRRYDRPDDFGLPETAFLVCSFWYADALHAVGRGEEARALFERVLAHRNHLGLLSEDLDPRTGMLWGNFPQAYSHVGLILSAHRLSPLLGPGVARGGVSVGRLVVVSNRVAVPRRGEPPAAGGLAVALTDAFAGRGGLWFGWSGNVAPDPPDVVRRARRGGVDYAVTDLSDADYAGFYAGYANAALWPLFHFRLGLLSYDRGQAETYRAVNRAFARKLIPLLRPDDTIWVHDYQLIPLGAALRDLGSRHRIGYFHHIPFPPWAVFSALPGGEDLIRDLLAYDLVGVQTRRDVAGLCDCMAQGTGMKVRAGAEVRLHGRRTRLRAFPIGIATDEFTATAERAVTSPEAARLRESLVGRALVIGAERLDYTKGLPERLRAFAALLEGWPEHRNRVTYLQVAARSREDVESYKDLKREIERLAGTINGEHGDVDWTPVRYVGRAVARDALAGYYRMAQVGLVTPLRDGMNLVAKEYVAAQDPEDPGVLVLSRFAGAAETMPEALLVNPLDARGMAEAMDTALRMPLPERQERHGAMLRRLREHTVADWCAGFLRALEDDAAPEMSQPPAREAA